MWTDVLGPDRSQMTIWRMRIACRTNKATNTYSEYVILIGFPLQQWLGERASLLRYTHIVLLSEVTKDIVSRRRSNQL